MPIKVLEVAKEELEQKMGEFRRRKYRCYDYVTHAVCIKPLNEVIYDTIIIVVKEFKRGVLRPPREQEYERAREAQT